MTKSVFCIFAFLSSFWLRADQPIRIGMIGLDTSHVTAFTQILNDPTAKGHIQGGRVVAAFKGGSPDIEASRSRVDGYTETLRRDYGVEICETIEELCTKVDAVMIESVDGRPHLAQARPVIAAGLPLFIDKPVAGSLGDVLKIYDLAERAGVPVFSSSSLRYGKNTQAVRAGALGEVTFARCSSPAKIEPHHPDLFWYGVHGCEALFTVMGPGCRSVIRETTPEGLIEVRGDWGNGRLGIFREGKGYSGLARNAEAEEMKVGSYDGYAPLVAEIVRFFKSGVPPVLPAETIELFAFMEAADESKRRGGEAVTLQEVLTAAQAEPGFRLMTFNVLRGGTQLGQPLSQCARVIRAARADVVGLQEIGGNAEELAELLGWQVVRDGSRAILTCFEVVERHPGGVRLKSDSGRELSLFNIHFRPSPYQPYQLLKIPYGDAPFITTEEEAVAAARQARGDQVEALLGEIGNLPQPDVPVFVTGDFNEPSHLDWTREAAESGRHPIKVSFPTSIALQKAGFHDAWRVVHPDPLAHPGDTWTPVTEITDPEDHHDRIDLVYFRGEGIEVRSAQVVGEKAETSDLVVTLYPSDHRAVVTHFVFREQEGGDGGAE